MVEGVELVKKVEILRLGGVGGIASLKILAASSEESSIPHKEFFILCSLTPLQATGNALAGIQGYYSKYRD